MRGDLGDGGLDVLRESRRAGQGKARARRDGSRMRGEVVAHRAEPLPLGGRGRVHRHSGELARERDEIDREAPSPGLVEHVQVEAEGHAELGDLQRQQQRANQVLRVADLHQRVEG